MGIYLHASVHLLPVRLSCLNQRLGSATSALSHSYKGTHCTNAWWRVTFTARTVSDCHCKDHTHRKTHKTGTYDIAWEAKPSETAALVSISNSIVRVSLCWKTRCTKHLCNNCWIFILHKNKYINKNTCNNNSTEGAKILISDKSSNLLDISSVT